MHQKYRLGKLIRAGHLQQIDDYFNTQRHTLWGVFQFELERILIGDAHETNPAEFDRTLDQGVLFVDFGDVDERLSTVELFVSLGESTFITKDMSFKLEADYQDLKKLLRMDKTLYSSATLSIDQFRQFFTSLSKREVQTSTSTSDVCRWSGLLIPCVSFMVTIVSDCGLEV